jgi:hypothetical protein
MLPRYVRALAMLKMDRGVTGRQVQPIRARDGIDRLKV